MKPNQKMTKKDFTIKVILKIRKITENRKEQELILDTILNSYNDFDSQDQIIEYLNFVQKNGLESFFGTINIDKE